MILSLLRVLLVTSCLLAQSGAYKSKQVAVYISLITKNRFKIVELILLFLLSNLEPRDSEGVQGIREGQQDYPSSGGRHLPGL